MRWLTALALVPAAAAAQTLSGAVTLPDGTPVTNYPVIVTDPAGASAVVITNPEGRFELPAAAAGQYTVQPSSAPDKAISVPVAAPGLMDSLTGQKAGAVQDVGTLVITPFDSAN